MIGLFASCTPLILCLIYGKQWTNRSRFFCIHKTSINVGWKEGHGQTDWNNIYLYLLRERERERKKIVNSWIIQRPYAFLGQSEVSILLYGKVFLATRKATSTWSYHINCHIKLWTKPYNSRVSKSVRSVRFVGPLMNLIKELFNGRRRRRWRPDQTSPLCTVYCLLLPYAATV